MPVFNLLADPPPFYQISSKTLKNMMISSYPTSNSVDVSHNTTVKIDNAEELPTNNWRRLSFAVVITRDAYSVRRSMSEH